MKILKKSISSILSAIMLFGIIITNLPTPSRIHQLLYLWDCMINNGHDPDKEDIIIRAREVIDASYGDYGEWVY